MFCASQLGWLDVQLITYVAICPHHPHITLKKLRDEHHVLLAYMPMMFQEVHSMRCFMWHFLKHYWHICQHI